MPDFSPSVISEILLFDWPTLEYTFFFFQLVLHKYLPLLPRNIIANMRRRYWERNAKDPPQLLLFSGKGWLLCMRWWLQNSCTTLILCAAEGDRKKAFLHQQGKEILQLAFYFVLVWDKIVLWKELEAQKLGKELGVKHQTSLNDFSTFPVKTMIMKQDRMIIFVNTCCPHKTKSFNLLW